MKENKSLYSVLALRLAVVLMIWQVAQFIHDRQQQDAYRQCGSSHAATSAQGEW